MEIRGGTDGLKRPWGKQRDFDELPSDVEGSWTGTPISEGEDVISGYRDLKPVQDADDL